MIKRVKASQRNKRGLVLCVFMRRRVTRGWFFRKKKLKRPVISLEVELNGDVVPVPVIPYTCKTISLNRRLKSVDVKLENEFITLLNATKAWG